MKNSGIDLRYVLIANYKKMGFDESTLAVLLVIDQLLSEGNSFIDAELLALRMSLKAEEIDKILTKLLKNKIISYEVDKSRKVSVSLSPLENLLTKQYQKSLTKANAEESEEEVANKVHNIYAEFEKYFQRSLSPIEYQKIYDWLDMGYSEEMILTALKEVASSKRRSFNAVDKKLLSMLAREDVDKEGYTTMSHNWDKNIEDRIKISKSKWLDYD